MSVVEDRLEDALRLRREGRGNQDQVVGALLEKWNDSVEKLFVVHAKQALVGQLGRALDLDEFEATAEADNNNNNNNNNQEASSPSSLSRDVCRRLAQLLLDTVQGSPSATALKTAAAPTTTTTMTAITIEEQAGRLLERWKKEAAEEEEDSSDSVDDHRRRRRGLLGDDNPSDSDLDDKRLLLEQVLRANKNWLRWYLQIAVPEGDPTPAHNSSSTDDDDGISGGCIIRDFMSLNMMELYLALTVRLVLAENDDDDDDDESNNNVDRLARQASQLFFYASFHHSSVSSNSTADANKLEQITYECFATDLRAFSVLLELLCLARTADFALSLGRSVHNLVVSFPQQAIKGAKETRLKVSEIRQRAAPRRILAPWVENKDEDGGEVAYEPVLRDCILWTLRDGGEDNSDDNNKFPGKETDHRGEMVVELLRVLFALQAGSKLSQPPADERLSQLVFEILDLDSNNKWCFECQLAVVPLLMDAQPSFGEALLGHDATLTALLRIFEVQLAKVLDSNRIDNSAAASLTPILVVLHRFCASNVAFRKVSKERIFPPQRDAILNERSSSAEESSANGKKTKQNMAPLDAPPGTLRAKVCRLLTWPEGHTKRFAGELVWVLCGGSSDEVVRRVGMGNALPILNAKGVVQLPSQLCS